MFDFAKTGINGVFSVDPIVRPDPRGLFAKTFHEEAFAEAGLDTSFRETYFSTSKQKVLRGLHFQVPPAEHSKLVYCIQGTVLDVVVDLRTSSATFQKVYARQLDGEKAAGMYIPAGCAHGFLTLSNTATLLYAVTSVYAPKCDAGVLWSSVGFAWPVSDPLVSDRDARFPTLSEFDSPFV